MASITSGEVHWAIPRTWRRGMRTARRRERRLTRREWPGRGEASQRPMFEPIVFVRTVVIAKTLTSELAAPFKAIDTTYGCQHSILGRGHDLFRAESWCSGCRHRPGLRSLDGLPGKPLRTLPAATLTSGIASVCRRIQLHSHEPPCADIIVRTALPH
jgi:hypothetical protein